MSIKTLRKRIALVAVSALGVGLLAVAPSRAAIAADELIVAAVGNGNTLATVCATDNTDNVNSAVVPLTSPGFVVHTTGTVVGNGAYISITGPAVIGSSDTNWSILSQTLATASALSATHSDNEITIRPTATGTIKITVATSSTSSAVDVITVTVVSACTNKALSLGLSKFLVSSATNATASATSFASRTTDDDASTVASGGLGYARMRLVDTYGAELLATKVLLASVSGANCLVNLEDAVTSGDYTAGSGATDVKANSGINQVVVVSQADSDIPAKCTATVSYDGTTIGTKTFTFRGIPSKITISDVTIGATGGVGYYRVTVEDSAGNPLPGVEISHSGSEANNAAAIAAGVISSAQSNSGALTTSTATSIGKTRAIASTTLATTGAQGPTTFACTAAGGTAKITARAVISAATASYLTSAPFDIACSGSLATWTVSMDKATYAPGEIATLTLSGKDSSGRPVSSFTQLSGVATAFGGMTAVTAPTDGDTFTSGAGIKTYQFSVGTSEGAFVGSFKTTGSVDTAAKTVQYKVANPNAAVSTNEVLAAIVKLIATINKQIRQLQKQLRR